MGEKTRFYCKYSTKILKVQRGHCYLYPFACVALFFPPVISYTVEIFQDCRRRAGSVIYPASALCSPPEIVYRDTSWFRSRTSSWVNYLSMSSLWSPLSFGEIEILHDSDRKGWAGTIIYPSSALCSPLSYRDNVSRYFMIQIANRRAGSLIYPLSSLWSPLSCGDNVWRETCG